MVARFKTILCPVDLTPNCVAAVALAYDFARHHGSSIYLLHVSPTRLTEPPRPPDDWEHALSDKLQRLGQEWLEGKVPYEMELRSGDPSAAILAAINDLGPDLVVMATHGRTGMDRLVLGSVAEQVIRASPVPILTVRPQAT